MKALDAIEWLDRTRPQALVVDACALHDDRSMHPELLAPDAKARAPAVAFCSLAQVRRWLAEPTLCESTDVPALAQRLRKHGAQAVCVTGVVHARGRFLDWLDSEHACGWLAPTNGAIAVPADVALFARDLGAALQRGFVAADAAVVARMLCSAAAARRPGGEVEAINDPALLPLLSFGEEPRFLPARSADAPRIGLYPLADSAKRLEQVLAAGVGIVQLRIKAPDQPDAAWWAMLRGEVERSVRACRDAGAELFVNDHRQIAAESGAPGVHLGQEDLLALGESGRSALLATGLALGVSSHSLWELCRARSLAPRYIACGPIWPTLTKAMPWVPQGLGNLAWWCRMAGAPVVAIGGVLRPEQVYDVAQAGADGACIVRGLGDDPQEVVPQLQAAFAGGRREYTLRGTSPAWPHPSLPHAEG